MWIPTILSMMFHLFIAGLLCLVVDEVNPSYTTPFFITYLLVSMANNLNNHYVLLANLMYNRDEFLKAFDEHYKREQ